MGSHPNRGHRASYSGLFPVMLIGLDVGLGIVPFLVGGGTMIHSLSEVGAGVLLLLLRKVFGTSSQSSAGMVIIALFMYSRMLASSPGGSNETVSN